MSCAYAICSYGHTSISSTIPDICLYKRVYSYSVSVLIWCIGLSDWSFRLCFHITYIYSFIVSYLFFLLHDGPYGIFCAVIGRHSITLLRFPIFSHVKVFSWEIPIASRWNCPKRCFSSFFIFWLFPFCRYSCCQYCYRWLYSVSLHAILCTLLFVVSTCQHSLKCWKALVLLLFLVQYNLSTSSSRVLFMVIRFLVLGSICFSLSLVLYKNGTEYLTKWGIPGIYPFGKAPAL